MTLKELRKSKNLTQLEASKILSVSLRSYKTYENDTSKVNTIKYKYMYDTLLNYNIIDEEHGILSLEEIKKKVTQVFNNYDINFCYLFGSYAKNKATDISDIDLVIDSPVTGLDFFGLVEDLRLTLNKKIDLLKINQLDGNLPLLKEVMKDGIKIYG